MSISVDSVATNADLADEIGGTDALDNLMRDPGADPSAADKARQATLDEVLESLRNRTPPVHSGDLSDVTELKPAVVVGTLARLYCNNITTGDGEDVNAAKYRIFQKRFESRLAALRPTISSSQRAGSGSIQFSRR